MKGSTTNATNIEMTLNEFKSNLQNILKEIHETPSVSELSGAHAKVYSFNSKTHLQLNNFPQRFQAVVDMCSELISEFGKGDERRKRMIEHILAPVFNQYVSLDRHENPNKGGRGGRRYDIPKASVPGRPF